MPRHLLTVAEGGVSARIQLKLLLGYASISRLLFRRRGLQRLSWTLGSFFPPRNSVILSQGARQFKIYLKDGYYTRLLPQGFVYEPEVAAILDKVISPDSVFVDCGANNGYWSVYAGLKSGHPERVLAIEPTSEPFARLEENRHLNNDSFRAVKRAIYSKSDVELQFAVHPHQHAMNTSTAWAGGWPADPRSPHELVRSITIDDVCEGMFPNGDTAPVVVKIDVEGAEIEAFQGAQKTINRGALLVYEDHGLERSCRNTEFLLKEFHLAVYLLRDAWQPIPIEDAKHLSRLKRDPKFGYNLIAGKPGSPSLEKALRAG